jgi:hypothetical protein
MTWSRGRSGSQQGALSQAQAVRRLDDHLCEGIGPAVRSGQSAAHTIVSGDPYTLDDATGASLGGDLFSRWMDWAFTRGGS